jgi:hypothetical protein
MWTLIQWGGFPIWFVLAFGFISLGGAALFARRPDKRQLAFVIGMSVATLFSILNGIVADLATVGHAANVHWDDLFKQAAVPIWSQGFAESMSPGIIGFTLLSLTWLVVATGLRRMPREAA